MSTAQVTPTITLGQLDHTATDAEIQPILDLSNRVFEAAFGSHQEGPNHSLSGWRSRLADPRSVIVYLTSETGMGAGGANEATHGKVVVGFFFACPRIQPEIGTEASHIWLAGIDESFRGQRLFQRLVEATMAHAVGFGFELMTVCTLPDVFTTMYRILQKNGWEFVAWREEEPQRKVLMKTEVK